MNELICTNCGKNFSTSDPVWKCTCGGLLDIDFETNFPVEKIGSRNETMWRYREAIPILNDSNILSFSEGYTPILPFKFNDRTVLVKQDHLFTTGSYKDRGASVLISKVKELGIKSVVEDSSGNAGCAIAAYCAHAGVGCEIYVPENTSPGKLAQIRMYGAKLRMIPGTREETARAVLAAAEQTYYASHSWNPYFFHGTKTFAFEVAEQLGWKVPDTVILPVGNGTLFLGAYMGFSELMRAGVIDNLPKLVGVQASSCAPIYKAISEDLDEIPHIEKKETIAEGIAIAEPIRGKQIIEAVGKTKGEIIVVDDTEIIESLKSMCKMGFYIEPTSAATTAGVTKYLEREETDEQIVSVFTGSGLKATEKMVKIMEG